MSDLTTVVLPSLPPHLLERKGGEGSGHHGHTGRPGKRGGSASRGAHIAVGGTLTHQRRQNLNKILGQLPADHLEHVARIDFLDFDEILEKKGFRMATASGNHESNEDGSEIIIKIVKDNPEAFAGQLDMPHGEHLVLHEVGHSVHSLIDPSGFYIDGDHPNVRKNAAFLGSPEERIVMASTVHALYENPNRTSLSTRGEVDAKEYFSESYVYYVAMPEAMVAYDPDCYRFMKDAVFGGREYLP